MRRRANLAAAVIFVLTGSVDWPMMVPLAIGTIVGSALGPPLLRRVPETTVRVAVALAGFALAGQALPRPRPLSDAGSSG